MSIAVAALMVSTCEAYAANTEAIANGSVTYIENNYDPGNILDNISSIKDRIKSLNISQVKPYYNDVNADSKQYEAIQALTMLGIVNGTGNNNFSPDRYITIGEFARMLFNTADPVGFSELIKNHGYEKAVDIEALKFGLSYIRSAIGIGSIHSYTLHRDASNSIVKLMGIRLFCDKLYDGTDESIIDLGYDYIESLNIFDDDDTYLSRADAAYLIYQMLVTDIKVEKPDMLDRINIEYEDDFYDLNALLLELDQIPDVILDKFNSNGWKLVAGNDYINEYNIEKNSNAIGLCYNNQKTIYVSSYTALVHEFGHFLQKVTYHPFEVVGLYRKEVDKLASISGGYCRTNTSEYFAEAFETYINATEKESKMTYFKLTAPLTWEYFDTIAHDNWEVVPW